MRTGPEHVLRLVACAMGAIVVALAAIELRTALQEDAMTGFSEKVTADDPLRRALARCRTLTPDEVRTDTACQAAWAENRRRFFGQRQYDQASE